MYRTSLLRSVSRFAILIGCAALTGACARTPAGVNQSTGAQLTVTMTVQGQINPQDYYFVVFSNSGDSSGTTGPNPAIGAPWGGTGFVTGTATQYVEYNGSNPGGGYVVGTLLPANGGLLQIGSPLAAPVSDIPVYTGSQTLQFRIPLSELATTSISTADTNYLQVNFINTDSLPIATTLTAQHDFSSLGDPLAGAQNQYITIDTLQNTTYSSSTLGNTITPNSVASCTGSGTSPDSGADAPNLQITSWSIQISGQDTTATT